MFDDVRRIFGETNYLYLEHEKEPVKTQDNVSVIYIRSIYPVTIIALDDHFDKQLLQRHHWFFVFEFLSGKQHLIQWDGHLHHRMLEGMK